jgi:branched-chain amino acid transport system substrate-binding protein
MTSNNDGDESSDRRPRGRFSALESSLGRRRILKITGGVGAGGMLGLAGCTGIGGDGGDGGGSGDGSSGSGSGDGGSDDGDDSSDGGDSGDSDDGDDSDDGETTGTPGKESFEVGVIVPMTGNFSSLGSLYRPAFEAWAQLINEQGGVDGHEVNVRFEDNESTEQRTSRIGTQFASDGVDFMINAYSSPLTRAAGNVAEQEQIPLFSTGSVNYEIHAGFDYVFEFEPPFARRASGSLLDGNVSKVACWAVDLGWAKLGQQAFIDDIAPQHDLEIVYEDTHARDQRDFSSFVLKALNNGAEAAVITNYPEHVVPQTRQISSSEWSPTYVSQTTASSGDIYDQLGAEVMEGLAVPVLWTKSMNRHEMTEPFIETYESLTDVSDAEYHGALGFGALQVFGEAIRALGNDAKDTATLQQWFMDNTAPTVMGESKFDDRGVQVGFPWSEAQWHGQDTPLIWPDDVAEAEFIYPKQWP